MDAAVSRLYSLAGRTALVTGSTSGIGLAMARLFAAAGARVIVHGRDDARVREVAATLAGAVPLAFDLADPASVAGAADRLQQDGCDPDILVLNAGVRDRRTLEEIDADAFESVMRINVTANHELVRHLGPRMAQRGWGRLVFVASLGAHLANPFGPSYAASKAAVLALMRACAVRYGAQGVTANAISPGFVATEFNSRLLETVRTRENLERRTPLQRAAAPDEIASVALFLAGGAASYVNGQDLAVDGGWSISL